MAMELLRLVFNIAKQLPILVQELLDTLQIEPQLKSEIKKITRIIVPIVVILILLFVYLPVIGSKRGNNINIFNGLNESIKNSRSFQSSGKVLQQGNDFLMPRQNTTLIFVNYFGFVAGSNGVIVWNLPKNKSLLIFYQNPLFGYNFAGICLIPQKPYRFNSQMKRFYKYYQNQYKTGSEQCIFGDNNQIEMIPYFQKFKLSDNDFSIKLSVKYELVEGWQPYDCYIQKLDINIGIK